MPDVRVPNATPCPALLARIAVSRACGVQRRDETRRQNLVARLPMRGAAVVPPLARGIGEQLGEHLAGRRYDTMHAPARCRPRRLELVPGPIHELGVGEVE